MALDFCSISALACAANAPRRPDERAACPAQDARANRRRLAAGRLSDGYVDALLELAGRQVLARRTPAAPPRPAPLFGF